MVCIVLYFVNLDRVQSRKRCKSNEDKNISLTNDSLSNTIERDPLSSNKLVQSLSIQEQLNKDSLTRIPRTVGKKNRKKVHARKKLGKPNRDMEKDNENDNGGTKGSSSSLNGSIKKRPLTHDNGINKKDNPASKRQRVFSPTNHENKLSDDDDKGYESDQEANGSDFGKPNESIKKTNKLNHKKNNKQRQLSRYDGDKNVMSSSNEPDKNDNGKTERPSSSRHDSNRKRPIAHDEDNDRPNDKENDGEIDINKPKAKSRKNSRNYENENQIVDDISLNTDTIFQEVKKIRDENIIVESDRVIYYRIGTYGAKGREKIRLAEKFPGSTVNGIIFDSEHLIPVGSLVLTVSDKVKRKKDKTGGIVERMAPAYFEVKTLHNEHIGTGNKNRLIDGLSAVKGIERVESSEHYRQIMFDLVEKDEIDSAIILNQELYTKTESFSKYRDSIEMDIATDSFLEMIKNNPPFIIFDKDGKAVEKKMNKQQQAKGHLYRL